MKSISSARKSTRGRPRVGATPVNTRFPPKEIDRLDAWIARQVGPLTRPEAVRRLVEQALAGSSPSQRSANARSKALDLAGKEIDKLSDQSASNEERQQRKQRLLKGPREFRDIRNDVRRKQTRS
jgi:hypothetical protein